MMCSGGSVELRRWMSLQHHFLRLCDAFSRPPSASTVYMCLHPFFEKRGEVKALFLICSQYLYSTLRVATQLKMMIPTGCRCCAPVLHQVLLLLFLLLLLT